MDRAGCMQQTIAQASLSVSLLHHFKGTHMSRFVEVLNLHRGEVALRTLPQILHLLRERLQAEAAQVEFAFPYFTERAASVTGSRALMDYECAFLAEANGGDDDFVLRVRVPGDYPVPVLQGDQ